MGVEVVAASIETALIQRAQQRDRSAFEQIYREHVDRVYALCLRLSPDASWAEDLTQDIFLRVWERLDSFREESAFSTWLHRIAVNVTLSALRADKRRSVRIFTTDDLTVHDRGDEGVDQGSIMDIEQAIKILPAQARQGFVLHEI